MTELQQAIANGTEHDVKIFIRETHGQYIPNEKHYVEIDSPYIHQDLNIKLVQPDVENEQFLMLTAGWYLMASKNFSGIRAEGLNQLQKIWKEI